MTEPFNCAYRRSKRKSSVNAMLKIKKILAWEVCDESSEMFKSAARAIDEELQEEILCVEERKQIETNEHEDLCAIYDDEFRGITGGFVEPEFILDEIQTSDFQYTNYENQLCETLSVDSIDSTGSINDFVQEDSHSPVDEEEEWLPIKKKKEFFTRE